MEFELIPFVIGFVVGSVIGSAVSFFYGVLPLLILKFDRRAGRPRFEPVDFAALDPANAEYLTRQAEELKTLGFDQAAMATIPDAVPNLACHVLLFVDRTRTVQALVTTMVATKAPWEANRYVQFGTEFDSGESLYTLNTLDRSGFPPTRGTTRVEFPNVTAVDELYQLHMLVLKRTAFTGSKVDLDPSRAVERLLDRSKRNYDEFVTRGRLRYDEMTDQYRLTIRGAYLSTWRILPPFREIRRCRLAQNERRLRAELRSQDFDAA
ncbi:MAG: hypothetical protein ACRDD1_12655 [Planctomycetia bacterium]